MVPGRKFHWPTGVQCPPLHEFLDTPIQHPQAGHKRTWRLPPSHQRTARKNVMGTLVDLLKKGKNPFEETWVSIVMQFAGMQCWDAALV